MSKRFEIITETDARTLDRGETVTLSPFGHITPLAADTLRERRVTVVRDGPALAAAVRAGKADADSGCWEELRVDANRCVALGSGSLPEGVVGYTEFLRILREISPS